MPEEQFSNNQERIDALRDQDADEAEARWERAQQEAEEGYEREVLGILPPVGYFDDDEQQAQGEHAIRKNQNGDWDVVSPGGEVVKTYETTFLGGSEWAEQLAGIHADELDGYRDWGEAEELAVDHREAARGEDVSEELHRYNDVDDVGERDDLSTGFGY